MNAKDNLASKIRSKPVEWFIIFTFLISWIIWILAPIIAGSDRVIQTGDQNWDTVVLSLVSYVGAFGPSLAAIIVSSILNPSSSKSSKRKRLTLFTIIFMVTISYFSLNLIFTTFNYERVLFSVLVSIIVAYVISSVYHPKQGVAELMQGLKKISAKNFWLWFAFLVPLFGQFLAAIIDFGLGGSEIFKFTTNSIVLLIINYPIILVLGGPLNEEPGWRGFLVPQLQTRFNPLKTGLIIGVIWTIWHLPLHLIGFYPGGISLFLVRVVYNIPLGIFFTWYYNRSKGNLFGCILLHTSVNVASGLFGMNSQLIGYAIIIVITAAFVIYNRMYNKNQNSNTRENSLL
ncbi:MAG: type II CAAX endopeptidase family protein [Candidatus Bathyarchaeota archaeon]